MKAIVLGYHNIGCVGIRALLRHGIQIAAVFTHPDDPHEALWFDSVSEVAAVNGLSVYAPEDVNHLLWINRIREMKPDILFSFYIPIVFSAFWINRDFISSKGISPFIVNGWSIIFANAIS
jgi:methionyl-tRNA formyltransferase